MSHAVLSPSGASRWLACPPSARLEQQFPDTSGDAAREGTLAHSLGELLLRYKTKTIVKPQFTKQLKEIQKNSLYSQAMYDHAEDYAVFVLERFSEAQLKTPDSLLFLEQSLDLTEWIEAGFGTGDTVIVSEPLLDIIDLKYGKGVLVNATDNKQMMLYALGALRLYDFLYNIEVVRMTIYQPRMDNYSTFEMTVQALLEWANSVLAPVAKRAYAGEGDYKAGDHCKFCRARAVCRTNSEYNLRIPNGYYLKASNLLKDTEISDILENASTFKSWLTSVQDYALDQAVSHGKKWPGFKLVAGKSNRVYASEEKVAKALLKAGFAEDLIYNKSVKGITALEKELGKAEFSTLLKGLVVKPDGKPTLVNRDDKRPEWSSSESAKNDFQTALA